MNQLLGKSTTSTQTKTHTFYPVPTASRCSRKCSGTTALVRRTDTNNAKPSSSTILLLRQLPVCGSQTNHVLQCTDHNHTALIFHTSNSFTIRNGVHTASSSAQTAFLSTHTAQRDGRHSANGMVKDTIPDLPHNPSSSVQLELTRKQHCTNTTTTNLRTQLAMTYAPFTAIP